MSTHISAVPEGLEWKQAYLAAFWRKIDSPRTRRRVSLPAGWNSAATRPVLVPGPPRDLVPVLRQESPASSESRSTAIADRRGSDRGASG
jgi:hypothetical protein